MKLHRILQLNQEFTNLSQSSQTQQNRSTLRSNCRNCFRVSSISYGRKGCILSTNQKIECKKITLKCYQYLMAKGDTKSAGGVLKNKHKSLENSEQQGKKVFRLPVDKNQYCYPFAVIGVWISWNVFWVIDSDSKFTEKIVSEVIASLSKYQQTY